MQAIGVAVKIVEPGAVRTDFYGRSIDFTNDDTLQEYQTVVGKSLAVFGAMGETGSEPELIAEVIYKAAIDGTNQLRYSAGLDAEQLTAARKAAEDAAFLDGIRKQFGL